MNAFKREHDVPAVCPFCGDHHDVAAGLDGPDAPSNGDATLCITCGEVAVFDSKAPGALRRPSNAEAMVIASVPTMVALKVAWREATMEALKAAWEASKHGRRKH